MDKMKSIECGSLPERDSWFIAAEEKDFLVVAKGRGIPSAPLNGGGLSVFEQVAESYPDVMSVSGKKEGEGGLLHRIDTETCGLLLIVRNDAFFRRIAECREAGTFVKEYTAYSLSDDGRLPAKRDITSRFRPFGKKGASVKPVFDDDECSTADKKKAGTRIYTTQIVESAVVGTKPNKHEEDLLKGKGLIRIVCRINEGFRHQVRSHLAYSGFPVLGDPVYGTLKTNEDCEMLFYASALSFQDKDGTAVKIRITSNVMDDEALRVFKSL